MESRTHSSTISNNYYLTVLLFEKNNAMKVVIYTAGTTKKGECSYSINNGSADECTCGHCDGHAVSMCYRSKRFHFITEMNKYKKDPKTSSYA